VAHVAGSVIVAGYQPFRKSCWTFVVVSAILHLQ
jgi:hypothetical protein